MTLIETHDIPKKRRKRSWHNLTTVFEDFRAMHVPIVNVTIDYAGGEYTNYKSAYNSLRIASKRYPEYYIAVVGRGTEIYLVRTDM